MKAKQFREKYHFSTYINIGAQKEKPAIVLRQQKDVSQEEERITKE